MESVLRYTEDVDVRFYEEQTGRKKSNHEIDLNECEHSLKAYSVTTAVV